MSLSDETVRQTYICDGVTNTYTITFTFEQNDEVAVERWDQTTGLTETLAYPADYSVTSDVTTSLIYDSGDKITIYRITPQTQETSLEEKGQISSDVLETTFDRGVRRSQEQEYDLTRALVVPRSDGSIAELPSQIRRASSFLYFDTNGDPIPADGVTDTAISTAMVPVVQAELIEDARLVMDLYSTSEVDSKIDYDVAALSSDLGGVGRTTETIKGNADNISTNTSDITTLETKEVPSGGTADQLLAKVDGTDYNTTWVDPPAATPPIGATYTQFNGQTAPGTLWSGTTWTNVSSTYADSFFRAEGTNAEDFTTQSSAQADQMGLHNHQWFDMGGTSNYTIDTLSAPTQDARTFNSAGSFVGLPSNYLNSDYYTSNVTVGEGTSETRPTNWTVRIWKRTA